MVLNITNLYLDHQNKRGNSLTLPLLPNYIKESPDIVADSFEIYQETNLFIIPYDARHYTTPPLFFYSQIKQSC